MGDSNHIDFYADPDGRVRVRAWTKGVPFEAAAQQQVLNIADMPFIHGHVAIMPDVHAGIGATVGSVIPTRGAIIPAAVGVDIGCGMMAVQTRLLAQNLPDSLAALRADIESAVPHGRTNNGKPGDRGAWGNVPDLVRDTLNAGGYHNEASLSGRYHRIVELHPKIEHRGVPNHLGTLGTGNHFIEICLDENDRVWVVLHSGSRGPGNAIGTYFISKAREMMQKFFVNLPDKDLAYFPEDTQEFRDYFTAVTWAQDYARENRALMMQAVLKVVAKHFPDLENGLLFGKDTMVNCHHNYVAHEHHFGENVYVTRKGAVRARAGDLGIIPGSMGARSYIVRGKGSQNSLHSCSHGAGRAMSRTQAKKIFTLEDHALATAGVECRKDEDVIDETPGAYKDIDAVMEAQRDLVEIVHTLKQVLCVKG